MSNVSSDLRPATAEWLVLVPTRLELEIVRANWPGWRANFPEQCPVNFQLCGFGPIVAAIQTVRLISGFHPAQVLLLGIAGTYAECLPVGQAAQFSHVGCYGVGVGVGSSFRTASQMGWQQWTGDETSKAIGDAINIGSGSLVDSVRDNEVTRLLLTTPAAADNSRAVCQRLAAFPDAIAEDMEGFAVAAACQMCQVPVSIVRGISNLAGDRHHANWRIESALAAAVQLGCQIIADKT